MKKPIGNFKLLLLVLRCLPQTIGASYRQQSGVIWPFANASDLAVRINKSKFLFDKVDYLTQQAIWEWIKRQRAKRNPPPIHFNCRCTLNYDPTQSAEDTPESN